MRRPRLLLVPQLTELEWPIKALLEDWAEVASYDAPGVAAESPVEPFGPAAVAWRGLQELDRRGWDRCVVVADEFAAIAAVRLMAARPETIQGFALGHACLSNRTEGSRPAIDPGVQAALAQLFHASYSTCVHSLAQASRGSYDDALVERYLERVPRRLYAYFYGAPTPPSEPLEERLRSLGVPMLFAKHEDCLLHTAEGYEDAVAAFPAARTVVVPEKPSTSPAFALALRVFCRELEPSESAK